MLALFFFTAYIDLTKNLISVKLKRIFIQLVAFAFEASAHHGGIPTCLAGYLLITITQKLRASGSRCYADHSARRATRELVPLTYIHMSKRMDNLKTKVDKNKVYSLDEAIKLIKETSGVKFDASVEVHANLGIDPKKGEQQVRATVSLPHGTGKAKKIAAFVAPDKEKEAKEAGADFVYGEEEIKKIKDTGKIEFDVAVTTPDMMPKLAAIAKVLGPKGLMPNPKTETVSPNVKKMIEELKRGKVTFKNDDTANVHQIVGKVSFSEAQLKENVAALLDALKKAKPATAKGTYIKNLVIVTTMGPAIHLSENS